MQPIILILVIFFVCSACHIGGRIDDNPGEQTLVYGIVNSATHSLEKTELLDHAHDSDLTDEAYTQE